MRIKILEPYCNLATVKDGRGGIFTFWPKEPIVEFNFMTIKASKIRGNHYHPEFDEYVLLTSGEAVIVTKDSPVAKEEFIYLSKGQCIYTPKNTSHVLYAITDCNVVSFLTKKWDECDAPIIHENLGMGRGDHGDPAYNGPKE